MMMWRRGVCNVCRNGWIGVMMMDWEGTYEEMVIVLEVLRAAEEKEANVARI